MNDERPSQTRSNRARQKKEEMVVVGIGASAGGLAALSTFLDHLPADTGMTYVVILHLSPKHDSSADKLLQRSTRMPVIQVSLPTKIEPNHVYVISPSVDLEMVDGWLQVQPATRPRGRHVAIDKFLRTLAETHRDRSIGIILSGTGSDGSVGVSKLKEQGGVTIVQLPEDAEYDDMPRSALATGNVDFVLPAVEIPQKLVQLSLNAREIRLPIAGEDAEPTIAKAIDPTRADEDAVRDILRIVSERTGHDFHHYKKATILRRIERRLQVNLLRDVQAYRSFLEASDSETEALLSDLLISVTNFFRDREAFETVEREIVPSLFATRSSTEPVRIWAAGCATGEEAYSLAMLLCDEADRMAEPPPLQVFATDIDERAIARARTGLYPASVVTDVPPSRLREYFSKEQQQYRVKKNLRDKVLFAMHNVLRDPPFSRMDLISCRNLLIYLDRDIQGRLLQMFHFALRPGGFLFLGHSESAETAAQYFDVVDKKNRIFRARAQSRSSIQVPTLPLRPSLISPPAPPPRRRKGFSFADIHQRVLELYAPPSVVVDADHNVVHASEHAGRYLRFTGGEPTYNVLKVVDPALRLELRSALIQAVNSKKSVEAKDIRFEKDGETVRISITARPFRDAQADAEFVLVLFDETEHPAAPLAQGEQMVVKDQVLMHLEDELQRTKERLQSTVEQSEISTEELKASNEELQAINEELRSATEELETSKEELQSVNEELTTVNHELKAKVEEAAQINDDLRNFIASTEIATIFVDADLRIKRYTPRAEDIFSIIPTDIGRRLLDITHRLHYPELADDAASAFSLLQVREREVRASDGRVFISRVLPYRTAENRIDGAVLTFVDVTMLRQAEAQARSHGTPIELASRDSSDWGVILLDRQGRVSSWSSGAMRLLGFDQNEMIGKTLGTICSPEDSQDFSTVIGLGRQSQQETDISERWYTRKDGSRFLGYAFTTPVGHGEDGFVLLLWQRQEAADQDKPMSEERSHRADAQAANALRDEFLAVMSHELKHPLNLISVNTELLARMPEVRASDDVGRIVTTLRRAIKGQSQIIDDLLDLSRMRTGKLRLNMAPVNLSSLVETIVESARADISAAELNIEFASSGPVVVRGDVHRIEQIVWNLLSNAIKFTPGQGHIVVHVAPEGEFGRLTVRDSGQGIDPDFLPRVFDMFGQAAARAASKQTGLGIGLALVRKLVNHHSGKVEVASRGIGCGSKFSVWLPLFVEKSRENEAEEQNNPLTGLNVLLVDDTTDTVEALQALLELEGAQVMAATSGQEALDLAEAKQFDLVVSDIGMPGMDGHDFMKALRQRPAYATTPSVALTGFGSSRDIENALAAGFTAHIGKPVSLASLLEAIRKLPVPVGDPG
ncbi:MULTISPECIES: CheR family methyltransferase [unclassified Pseudoxanthomonas]|uniref:CheR family methyltransferase n=1 Tax=unclassified Pseudoxanthomonas TaxID=2645906 RepID=UPI003077C9A0